jgi:hypothetical protein
MEKEEQKIKKINKSKTERKIQIKKRKIGKRKEINKKIKKVKIKQKKRNNQEEQKAKCVRTDEYIKLESSNATELSVCDSSHCKRSDSTNEFHIVLIIDLQSRILLLNDSRERRYTRSSAFCCNEISVSC